MSLGGRPSHVSDALWEIERPGIRAAFVASLARAVDKLEDETYDGVVLAARRMTCIASLLRSAGMRAPTRGTMMSDRFFLLTPQDELRWSNALMLDDTIVSGAILQERYSRVSKHTPKVRWDASVAVRLGKADLEIDAALGDSLVRLFDFPEEYRGNQSLEDELRDELHLQFARAMSANLIPYFTDFPISGVRRTSQELFHTLIENPLWISAEVTNSACAGRHVRTFSLFPSQEFAEAVFADYPALSPIVQVLKVRLFVREEGADVSFRVVPILLLNNATNASLRRAGIALGLPECPSEDWPSQVLGYIGYLFSCVAMERFSSQTMAAIDAELELDSEIADLVLGPYLAARLDDHLAALDRACALITLDDSAVSYEPKFDIKHRDAVAKLPSRRIVVGDNLVTPSYHFLQEKEPDVPKARRSLKQLMRFTGSNANTISLALDILNDLGLAVPELRTTASNSGRSYRVGEARPRVLTQGRLSGVLASISSTSCLVIQGEQEALQELGLESA